MLFVKSITFYTKFIQISNIETFGLVYLNTIVFRDAILDKILIDNLKNILINETHHSAYERLCTSDLQRSDLNINLEFFLPIYIVLWVRLKLSRVKNMGPVIQVSMNYQSPR